MEQAFLRGREHRRIGGLALEAVGPVAAALSRGGALKTYDHTDPNEDCAAFALGLGGALLIAADGHHGDHGSEAAVEALLAEFAPDWTAESTAIQGEKDWREQAYEALLRANAAILETAARQSLAPAPTTFVACLVRPGDDLVLHFSVGDSHVFGLSEDRAEDFGGRDPAWKFTPFLGYEQASRELLEQFARVGVRPAAALDALVLATDGLSEPGIGLADPAGGVASVAAAFAGELPAHRVPVELCRGVADAAMAAHVAQRAGDNIACAAVCLDAFPALHRR